MPKKNVKTKINEKGKRVAVTPVDKQPEKSTYQATDFSNKEKFVQALTKEKLKCVEGFGVVDVIVKNADDIPSTVAHMREIATQVKYRGSFGAVVKSAD